MRKDTIAKCLTWEINDEIDIFFGEHYGYKRFSQPVIHRREKKFHRKEGTLEIIDRFQGEGKHNLKWNFILCPSFESNLEIDSRKLQWHKESVFYSPEYGTITKTQKLTMTSKAITLYSDTFWFNKVDERNGEK